MQQITELERRISAALERVGKGLDKLSSRGAPLAPAPAPAPAAPPPVSTGAEDAATLRAQLEEERTATAQLQERLKAVKD
ncbi:MAG: hypothetical protein WAS26_02770, partial [Paracoccaceae bacterium]